MRAYLWLAALAVGLAFSSRGMAQTTGFFGGSSASTASTTSMTKSTSSGFSLGGLLQRLRMSFGARQTTGYSQIPDPSTNSAEYLKAFGYQKLR